jgi:preprotein translocase subunit SecA
MFVIFGGDGLKNILSSFRVPDEMPVESPQVTNALDKVQAVVEEKYREIREQILNFDDILNDQRRVIYKRRQDILFLSSAASLKLIDDYNKQTVADIVSAQAQNGNVVNHEKLLEKFGQFFPPVAPFVNISDFQHMDKDGVIAFLNAAVDEVFRTKVEDLDRKAHQSGKPSGSLARSANYILLVSIDNAWSDHLQRMEDLKEAVVLRKYQNRDPVSEYRVEALSLFQGLTDKMRFNAIYSLWQSLV